MRDAFLVASARERAERVVVDRAFGLLDKDAWDGFVARLAAPPTPKPELAKLLSEPDIFE